jgi:uncharacterized SAM-binding protein YcdF (DUF218 family)
MRKLSLVMVLLFIIAVMLFSTSGAFLVVNDPQHADLILVLAGETDRRPARGLELLKQEYAPRLILDVPATEKIFDQQTIDIAQKFVNGLPQHERIKVCPIFGLSTKTEAQDVKNCLAEIPANRILLVTSDYHTRRALSTFRHELAGRRFFIAAAEDPKQFGNQWWKHRQWAKMNLDEWLKLVWWEVIDRWRK